MSGSLNLNMMMGTSDVKPTATLVPVTGQPMQTMGIAPVSSATFVGTQQVLPTVVVASSIPNSPSRAPMAVTSTPSSMTNSMPASTAQLKAPPSVPASASNSESQILTRSRLQDLAREIDPAEQLDEDVEEFLLQMADDFVENTVSAACLLARHRHASSIDTRDVQLYLERNWNMWIPGFGTDELRPYKRAAITEAHKQRLALIRKALKKY